MTQPRLFAPVNASFASTSFLVFTIKLLVIPASGALDNQSTLPILPNNLFQTYNPSGNIHNTYSALFVAFQ